MKKLFLLSVTILMFAFTLPALDVGLRDNVPKYGYVPPSQKVDVTIPVMQSHVIVAVPEFNYCFVKTQLEQGTVSRYGFTTLLCNRSMSVEYPLITHCSNSNLIYNINYKQPVKQGVPHYTIANSKVNLCEAPTGQATV